MDKPVGWIVNDATTVKDQPVLQNWLAQNLDYPLSKSREYRSGIVHRLDKETSGVMLIAKTPEMFEYLQAQFKSRMVQKTYLALVHGVVSPWKGTIEATVGRLPWRRDRFGVLPGGREATTLYQVTGTFEQPETKEKLSLVECYPKTGRTHQIRIHLKHLGHAIVGDPFYAGRKTARNDRKWCPRIFLHALKIEFTDPGGGKLKFESKLPTDLQAVLDTLNLLK